MKLYPAYKRKIVSKYCFNCQRVKELEERVCYLERQYETNMESKR